MFDSIKKAEDQCGTAIATCEYMRWSSVCEAALYYCSHTTYG